MDFAGGRHSGLRLGAAEVKEALAEVRKLYEEKLLDDSFMLRTMANIAELIVDGKCGSFFGPWWA